MRYQQYGLIEASEISKMLHMARDVSQSWIDFVRYPLHRQQHIIANRNNACERNVH